MDETTKELVAVGASAAVNCHPCLAHHLAECDRIGIDREEVKTAVDVGMMVNRGAAAKTREYAQTLLGADADTKAGSSGCCCSA